MKPPVGVFIPAHNAAPYVGVAIESVLAQTYSPLTLLVLDDASTDATQQVVKPYLADARVSYVRNDINLGMSRNWNKGLALTAHCRYVAKLDADDYYMPDFLQHAIAALESNREVGLA